MSRKVQNLIIDYDDCSCREQELDEAPDYGMIIGFQQNGAIISLTEYKNGTMNGRRTAFDIDGDGLLFDQYVVSTLRNVWLEGEQISMPLFS